METKTERRKLNRIKAALAETGHNGIWLAEQRSTLKFCTLKYLPFRYCLHIDTRKYNYGEVY